MGIYSLIVILPDTSERNSSDEEIIRVQFMSGLVEWGRIEDSLKKTSNFQGLLISTIANSKMQF